MTLFNLTELRRALRRHQRLIGIDPGRRRIGLALSDVDLRVASPYGVLARAKLRVNAAEIAAIAAREDVGGLVVGFPLAEDGSMGPAAQAARDWARDLSGATGLPAAMWDERSSSTTVHALLIEADLGRKRRAALVDKMAAAHVLQQALDVSASTGQNE